MQRKEDATAQRVVPRGARSRTELNCLPRHLAPVVNVLRKEATVDSALYNGLRERLTEFRRSLPAPGVSAEQLQQVHTAETAALIEGHAAETAAAVADKPLEGAPIEAPESHDDDPTDANDAVDAVASTATAAAAASASTVAASALLFPFRVPSLQLCGHPKQV